MQCGQEHLTGNQANVGLNPSSKTPQTLTVLEIQTVLRKLPLQALVRNSSMV